ncbi:MULTISPECIES: oxidoreductase [Mesobacillus]|uniref:Short-chain dehydrogenase n=2 Tax=Mesobacillus TaxID=2675231 RepID=A0A0D6ZBC6_9BACI|nr:MULTISPECIES: oxidoreductase [Mesobacillus]KIY22797.1 short-chain dehydrogenase [Mesobacillus subterraneus]MDQ0413237.1 NAD(P)-dependent dehydrogenase (short-subunit alcohol dehydrogenase family) [Mesobacillus stamsii]
MLTDNLSGKIAVITGANSGIGFEAAKYFSAKGAFVILAVRNESKGQIALESILRENPNAKVNIMKLDLADLKSVRNFAKSFMEKFEFLNLLVNNAGVMIPPYGKTKDGFELQFGSNHLGHFALTGLLLPLLKNTPGSRVVTLSSIAHRGAKLDFDNLDGSKGYKAMKFYGQSKLANLLFAKELDNRFKQHEIESISVACHPGLSNTNLFHFGKGETPAFIKGLMKFITQPAEKGSLPTIYAATEDSLKGGEYIGPDGRGNRKGNPAIEVPASNVYNIETMNRLWSISEEMTDVFYHF